MKKTTSLFILMVFATVSMGCNEQIARGSATAPAAAAPDADVDTVALATRATGVKFGAFIEKIPGGRIDWSRGVVYAMGIGKPRQDHVGAQATAMAKRAAYIVAARNATLVLAGIAPGPGGRFHRLEILQRLEDVRAFHDGHEVPQDHRPGVRVRGLGGQFDGFGFGLFHDVPQEFPRSTRGGDHGRPLTGLGSAISMDFWMTPGGAWGNTLRHGRPPGQVQLQEFPFESHTRPPVRMGTRALGPSSRMRTSHFPQ